MGQLKSHSEVVAEELLAHYMGRGVGHTHAAEQVVMAHETAKLVTCNWGDSPALPSDKKVCFEQIQQGQLRGLLVPLVLDNLFIQHLLGGLLRDLSEARKKADDG